MEAAADALIAAGGHWAADQGRKYGKRAWSGLKTRVRKFFSGKGDYQLNANSLIDGGGAVAAGTAVQIIPKGNGDIRIIFKEYLGEVTTHPVTIGAFYNTSYSVNAGLIGTFPWLCMIAQQFDYAKYNGVVFCYQSSSSEATTSFNLGSVIMATEYDILDPAFASKQEMLNCAYSQMFKPSEDGCHGIECAPGENPREIYINRQYNVPVGADLREYDLCNFQIATQGSAAPQGTVLGSLFVVYDITLKKNQMYNGPLLNGALNWSGNLLAPTATAFGSSVATSNGNMNMTNFSTAALFPNVTALGFRNLAANTNEIDFNSDLAGCCFEVYVYLQGQAPGPIYGAMPTIQFRNWFLAGAPVDASQGTITVTRFGQFVGQQGSGWTCFLRVRLTGQFPRLSFEGMAGLITPAAILANLFITQIPDAHLTVY